MPKLDRPKVRLAMGKARMKRADLAAASGIKPRTLTNALGLNHQTLDVTKIYVICEVLGLDYEDAIERAGEVDAA